MRTALALIVVATAFAVAGCGDDDDGGETETVTVKQTAPNSSKQGPAFFSSPSGNIGCHVGVKGVRCDIRERTWKPPPEPESCKEIGLDYGQGIALGATRAEFVCAGDTVLGAPAKLPYGANSRRGDFRCHSGQKGVTCSHAENGHGFFLSRQSYRVF